MEAEERALTALVPEVARRVGNHVAGTARQLLERLEALQTYLQTEIGKTIVIARTKRQLFGRVALARLLQEDLLEDEEACLLPVLRTRLSEARQWEILRLLLIDQDAEPPDTMVAWIAQDVTDPERQALATLTTRLAVRCQRSIAPRRVCTLTCARPSSLFMSARRQPVTMDIPHCDSPIDIMYLIHNALRAEATVTDTARPPSRHGRRPGRLCAGVAPVDASTLEEHAVIEDTYMTPLLPARPVVQDNEVEHQRLTTLFHEIAVVPASDTTSHAPHAAPATPGAGPGDHSPHRAR